MKLLFKALLLGLLIYMVYKAYRLYKAGTAAVDTAQAVVMSPLTLAEAAFMTAKDVVTGTVPVTSVFSDGWNNVKSLFGFGS